MHNVEFKAELKDTPLARAIARAIGATHTETLDQTDTYFRVPHGRLKKRESTDVSTGQRHPTLFIFYDRANIARPKLSNYTIYSEDEARQRFGVRPMPIRVVVRKRREVWISGFTRIHLDDVESLGAFLECEALVSQKQTVVQCRARNDEMRKAFMPVLGEPIAVSYADMLEPDTTDPTPAQ
ncbi:MAG: CYTH domain-containing protein [Phycisphaerales bacterium JB059]